MAVDQAKLLKDLRGQVTTLEQDLRERSESVEEYRSSLNQEYAAAREAQRIAATYTAWRDERITQVAVAWVLATVFVRFCEDNSLIESAWLAGPGERVRDAEDRHNAHFQQHPEQNDRDWLIAAIRHLASTNETVAGLFDEAHNPLWELEPSYEAATALLTFWRRRDPNGEIVHDFTDSDLNTRFLGDLYQNLSESARKTYALLQTPEFVEEFILDLTLEPAVKEFGLAPEWRYRPSKRHGPEGEMPTGLRTIDPACGSGHFLLGIFHRLLAKWEEAEPGTDRWELIRRTLESVHGCDKNPFAVAIARFRLLVAVLLAANETRLDRAPTFPINIAVGDSLLHGRNAETVTNSLFSEAVHFTYTTEDIYEYAARCDLLGRGSYHVVVGNPPYIKVADKQERKNYARAYAAGSAPLAVLFAQRVFELAIRAPGSSRLAGYGGQITSNAFMKRDYGRKLIEQYFPMIDLSHILDTSGAHIPGHNREGTPTVILIGRNRISKESIPIRVALGKKGEPRQTEGKARSAVWTAILQQTNQPGTDSEWISIADKSRADFSYHPWSLAGDGSDDLVKLLDTKGQPLSRAVNLIGRTAHTGYDESYIARPGTWERLGVSESHVVPLIEGRVIRDWTLRPTSEALFPYGKNLTADLSDIAASRILWAYRCILRERREPGGSHEEIGLTWYEWSRWHPERFSIPLGIAYAFKSSHNHFALDRGNKVFKQTAPVIKLQPGASEEEHLALLGVLNSSTTCFWLRANAQHQGGGSATRSWSWTYEFASNILGRLPVPENRPLNLARKLDSLVPQATAASSAKTCAMTTPTRSGLKEGRERRELIRGQLIGLQEELDWEVYASYGLLSQNETSRVLVPPKMQSAIPAVKLGERAFEIFLAQRSLMYEIEAGWLESNEISRTIEPPGRWPTWYQDIVRQRIELLERRRDIRLIEHPNCKRPWGAEAADAGERLAMRDWMLNHCEEPDLWFSLRDGLRHPRSLTVSQLADQFRTNEEMQSVATLYASDHLDQRDLPLAKVLEEVIKDEHVPYLAALRYTDTGLNKRAEWDNAWEQQREEDRTGRRLDIAVPLNYVMADFRKTSYWANRGKLDVSRERFISYPGASPDSDDTLLLGWAGWDHKDQAQALVNLVNDRTEQAAWETERLKPLLAGLLEVMPWVHQWHGEYDADWEGVPAEEFQAFLDDRRSKHQLSEQDLRAWRPASRGRKKKS